MYPEAQQSPWNRATVAPGPGSGGCGVSGLCGLGFWGRGCFRHRLVSFTTLTPTILVL